MLHRPFGIFPVQSGHAQVGGSFKCGNTKWDVDILVLNYKPNSVFIMPTIYKQKKQLSMDPDSKRPFFIRLHLMRLSIFCHNHFPKITETLIYIIHKYFNWSKTETVFVLQKVKILCYNSCILYFDILVVNYI